MIISPQPTWQWRYRVISSTISYEIDEQAAREEACHLALFLSGGEEGRWEGDPVHDWVTEGRVIAWRQALKSNPKARYYSSCADLGHTVLWSLLGAECHDEPGRQIIDPMINRGEAFGWRDCVNVSELVFGSKQLFVWHRAGEPWRAQPGDILVIGEHGAEHVAVVLSCHDGELISADYGQFNPKTGLYGARVRNRTVARGPDRRLWATGSEGSRPVLGHVDLCRTLRTVSLASQGLPVARCAP